MNKDTLILPRTYIDIQLQLNDVIKEKYIGFLGATPSIINQIL